MYCVIILQYKNQKSSFFRQNNVLHKELFSHKKLYQYFVKSSYSVSSLVVQISVKLFCFSIPKFQNRIPQNWLNQISNKNYLTFYTLCSMLNNFYLIFGAQPIQSKPILKFGFSKLLSKTYKSISQKICTTRCQTLYKSL